MTTEVEQLEANVARNSAQLLQIVLQLAQLTADDPEEAAGIIARLTAARLIVTADRSRIAIEVHAPGAGNATRPLYAATFEETSGLTLQ